MIKKSKTNIDNCFVIETIRHQDCRGYFEELFNYSLYSTEINCQLKVAQVNHSFSHKRTLRGIHVSPYYKLVHCLKGEIFDVCVDFRKESKTYLNYFSINLKENENKQLFIPPHCGHGFLAIKKSEIIYSQGGVFEKDLDINVAYNDLKINIDWPKMKYIISEKDLNASEWIQQ